jgi:hypothetical protein
VVEKKWSIMGESPKGSDRDPVTGKYFDQATGTYASKTPVLESGVADDMHLQEAANRQIIEDVRKRLNEDEQPPFDNVQQLIRDIQSAGNFEGTAAKITQSIIDRSGDISYLGETRPALAESLINDIALAIKKNENLAPWREAYQAKLMKALKRLASNTASAA